MSDPQELGLADAIDALRSDLPDLLSIDHARGSSSALLAEWKPDA